MFRDSLFKTVKRILRLPVVYLIYQYYVQRNRRIDYFDYKRLAHPFPIFSLSELPGMIGNKCYGNIFVIKKKMRETFHSHCMIEHGLYFGEYVIESECTMNCIDTIYTFSNYRVNAIQKHFNFSLKKKIIPLGPYIKYAENFKSKNELDEIKRFYGKILLVFPTHDSPEAEPQYKIELFLKEIENISKYYDTVFVSLYWLDIIKGRNFLYEQKGYKIVCSGMRNDPFFLNRQRDIIELADMSMSNDIGTHIGYCICLGTPHYIFKQTIDNLIHDTLNAQNTNALIRKREYNEIYNAFSTSQPLITRTQLDVVEKYWGKF